METGARGVIVPVTPTGNATTSTSGKLLAGKHKQSTSQATHPGYPSADRMPQPSCSRTPVGKLRTDCELFGLFYGIQLFGEKSYSM